MTTNRKEAPSQPAVAYLTQARAILDRIEATQLPAIAAAAERCAEAIAAGGLVHCFGTGHSRIPIEELFPRHGSFPGFHPIVELSLTHHTQVVGANGQRQAMWLERLEGFGEVILRNFNFGPDDVMLVFSNSGVNGVVVDVAIGAKARGMPVIAVVSLDHCLQTASKHSTGKRLPDIADITIDNGAPAGDAMVHVEGVDDPVGPGSTIGFAAVVNALKVEVAASLARRGAPPLVLTSSHFLGNDAAATRFDACYDDHSNRISRLYHWPQPRHSDSHTPRHPESHTPRHPESHTPRHPESHTPRHPDRREGSVSTKRRSSAEPDPSASSG